MLDFSAMYASTMHAALLMLTRNYTNFGDIRTWVSCIFMPYMTLRFVTAGYMQLVGKELNSPEVILSLLFFNSFPMKVSGSPAHSSQGNSLAPSPERQLRYLYHTILYLYRTYTVPIPYLYTVPIMYLCRTYTVPILYLYHTYTIAYLFPCAIVSTL